MTKRIVTQIGKEATCTHPCDLDLGPNLLQVVEGRKVCKASLTQETEEKTDFRQLPTCRRASSRPSQG